MNNNKINNKTANIILINYMNNYLQTNSNFVEDNLILFISNNKSHINLKTAKIALSKLYKRQEINYKIIDEIFNINPKYNNKMAYHFIKYCFNKKNVDKFYLIKFLINKNIDFNEIIYNKKSIIEQITETKFKECNIHLNDLNIYSHNTKLYNYFLNIYENKIDTSNIIIIRKNEINNILNSIKFEILKVIVDNGGVINSNCIKQLLLLNANDFNKTIHLILNSKYETIDDDLTININEIYKNSNIFNLKINTNKINVYNLLINQNSLNYFFNNFFIKDNLKKQSKRHFLYNNIFDLFNVIKTTLNDIYLDSSSNIIIFKKMLENIKILEDKLIFKNIKKTKTHNILV